MSHMFKYLNEISSVFLQQVSMPAHVRCHGVLCALGCPTRLQWNFVPESFLNYEVYSHSTLANNLFQLLLWTQIIFFPLKLSAISIQGLTMQFMNISLRILISKQRKLLLCLLILITLAFIIIITSLSHHFIIISLKSFCYILICFMFFVERLLNLILFCLEHGSFLFLLSILPFIVMPFYVNVGNHFVLQANKMIIKLTVCWFNWMSMCKNWVWRNKTTLNYQLSCYDRLKVNVVNLGFWKYILL